VDGRSSRNAAGRPAQIKTRTSSGMDIGAKALTGNSGLDSLNLDPQHPGRYQERVSDLLGLQDVNKTDLSAFEARGGKLLLMHGLADGLVATEATTEYYLRLIGDMGLRNVREFVRYYTIPGLGHVFGSPSSTGGGFFASWDPLPALDAWVESGTAPSGLVTTASECPDEGAHPPGLRVAVVAQVQRHRRSQQRRELHLRALRRTR
jgi:hypothetical protein